jgi:haloacid dehalogenase-like hydrolase
MSDLPKIGGRVAAIFDLDGTLVPEPSLEWRFFRELRCNQKISFANYFRWTMEALRLLPAGPLAVQHGNKRYLAGIYRDLAFQYTGSISFFAEGIARVAWHSRQGHDIVLLTGTLESLAQLRSNANWNCAACRFVRGFVRRASRRNAASGPATWLEKFFTAPRKSARRKLWLRKKTSICGNRMLMATACWIVMCCAPSVTHTLSIPAGRWRPSPTKGTGRSGIGV